MSSYDDLLREMSSPMIAELNRGSVLLGLLEREMAEQKRLDDEYLASLSPARRQRVLFQRRLARAEARFCEARDFRRCECE